ncbi:SgcJ/EcaC family oxidoreductase [Sphaerisporangium sp. NPDC005289]|uniref:SgcJ/EcaC family oxidoreductase n=1 Tax=Sphaerisporangium sp. NPDC005289 TaxID=3155247 RepID=UPI0033BC4C7D
MGLHRHGRASLRLALAAALGFASTGAASPAITSSSGPASPSGAVAAAPGQAPAPAAAMPFHTADLAAFARIRRAQEDAWARGDGRAYAAPYAPDADLINILGENLHGRQGIAVALQRYFQGALRHTRVLVNQERVRFVSPAMAVIIRQGCVLYGAEKACRPDTLSINTSVAVKQAGRWQITSFQNTLVSPAARERFPAKPPPSG